MKRRFGDRVRLGDRYGTFVGTILKRYSLASRILHLQLYHTDPPDGGFVKVIWDGNKKWSRVAEDQLEFLPHQSRKAKP